MVLGWSTSKELHHFGTGDNFNLKLDLLQPPRSLYGPSSCHVGRAGLGAGRPQPISSGSGVRRPPRLVDSHLAAQIRLPGQRTHHAALDPPRGSERLWEDGTSYTGGFVSSGVGISRGLQLTSTQFERGTNASTHTSQSPIAVECSLPVGARAGSDKYRSVNDPTNQAHKKFLLVDTPGHGKLRHHALQNITSPQNLKGLIFLVDAATLSTAEEGLRQTADYLHDILLILQKRTSGGKTAKALKEISVLIAANKMDLFTALPAALVGSSLEAEITKVRNSRSKGLLDSGIGMSDALGDENDDWLGEVGSKEFKFSQMEEFDITVEVLGGNVLGGEGPSVDKWWRWVSERL